MNNNENSRIGIAYIGGGSCGFGWQLIPELAAENICAMVRLYDTDKTCALANEVIGNGIHDKSDSRGDVVYLAYDEAEEALRDVDYVILSFDPGSLDELVSELHMPEGYGMIQTDGENSGLCSVIKALKMMPLCAQYARLIKKVCPKAWVINLCTPVAQCMAVMLREFPEMKLLSPDCSGSGFRDLMASMIAKEREINGIRRRDIKTNVIGISGFEWVDSVTYDGQDMIPMFREYAEKYSESGVEFRTGAYKTSPYESANKIKFDLFLRCGIIPEVPDRVAAEFVPGWYSRTAKDMAQWKFSPMTADYKKKLLSEKASKVKKYMAGESLPVTEAESEVPAIIRALNGGGNQIAAVSLPNKGQVRNLPEGTIVTTNALVSRQSVRPVAAGPLPDDAAALSVRHIYNRRAVVRAYEERDLDIAFNAFLNDPVICCSLSDATKLFRQMLEADLKHLAYYCEE